MPTLPCIKVKGSVKLSQSSSYRCACMQMRMEACTSHLRQNAGRVLIPPIEQVTPGQPRTSQHQLSEVQLGSCDAQVT